MNGRAFDPPTTGVAAGSDSGPRAEARPDPLRELALAAGGGDRAATEDLVAALAPALLAVARRILGAGDADVEDAAQESLVAVVRALRAFRGDSSVAHYAKRIAARTCLAVRKRRKVRERHAVAIDRLDVVRGSALPNESAAAGRRREAMRSLLDQLPDEQAETLTLRVVLGMSLAEVAEATGAPVNTVRSRVRLAREALRKRIEADPAAAALFEEAS